MKTPLPPVLRAALYRRAVACAWLTVCERQHRYPHLTLESLEAAIAAELEGFYLRQHGEEKGRQIACALLEDLMESGPLKAAPSLSFLGLVVMDDGLKLVEKVFGVSPSDAATKVAAVTGSLPPADPAVMTAAGAETDAARKNAAALAQTLMAKTRPGTGNAYLTRKGFPGRECRMLTGTHRAGGVSWRAGDLVVPLYDDSGELVNLTNQVLFEEQAAIKKENLKGKLQRAANLNTAECERLKIVCIASNPNGRGLPFWFGKPEHYESRSRINDLKKTAAEILKANVPEVLLAKTGMDVVKDIVNQRVTLAHLQLSELNAFVEKNEEDISNLVHTLSK